MRATQPQRLTRSRQLSRRLVFGTTLVLLVLAIPALTLARQGNLREILRDDAIAARWIYDDWPAAQARAKQTGKPILAVFRCVP